MHLLSNKSSVSIFSIQLDDSHCCVFVIPAHLWPYNAIVVGLDVPKDEWKSVHCLCTQMSQIFLELFSQTGDDSQYIFTL